MFSLVDKDSSGTLESEEIRALAAHIGFCFSNTDLLEAMGTMGDEHGEVNFESFYRWWKSDQSPREALSFFHSVDTDGGGTLDRDEVRELN